MTIDAFFKKYRRIALAFSGGVDSSYLLYAGLDCDADIVPYYVKTQFQPQFELDDALRLSKQLGVRLEVIELDIFSAAPVAGNPPDRCYHCKRSMLGAVLNRAQADGCDVLIDGTNASDSAGDRPGMRALKELSVRSPLRECGLTKDDVRRLSREAGLFTWDKPAYACLATRIPTDMTITPELLRRVERAEDGVAELGFSDFRVRVFGDAARIQLKNDQLAKAVALRNDLLGAVKPYFAAVFLDLDGR